MPLLYAILGPVAHTLEHEGRELELAMVWRMESMPRFLFVTGKLAAASLESTLSRFSPDFKYEIAILPISVAALMDAGFIGKHLKTTSGIDKVFVPGLCHGDLAATARRLGVEVVRGPESLKDIPAYFGCDPAPPTYGAYGTKIIAEIVDAYKLQLDGIAARADYYIASGADIIDLGCPTDGGFQAIGDAVKALKMKGYAVSVDSFNPEDILKADAAGVDYVLSVNSSNIDLARRVHCKVVVVPDFEEGTESLDRNIAKLESWNVRYIIDPVLSPLGFGLAESIRSYVDIRRKYPNAEMLMGLGNLTELTDADTTGITAVMAGIMAELRIEYALTTEVISWARGAVRELDLARRIMHYAYDNKVLPKRLSDELITVKDPPFEAFGEDELRAMQQKVRDHNFRIFADRSFIYVFNSRLFIKDTDIKSIFGQLCIRDASQAFYMGKELQKALLAVRLGKRYIQENNLRWGYLDH